MIFYLTDDLTLEQLDDVWAVRYEAEGLTETVMGLWRLRAELRAATIEAKNLRALLRRWTAENGGRMEVAGKRIVVIPARAGVRGEIVRSEDVKRRSPAVWLDSHTLKPRVSVAKGDGPAPGPEPRPLPTGATPERLLELLQTSSATVERLIENDAALRDRLNIIAGHVTPWDGTRLDTLDGWSFQTAVYEFSADRLREISPGVYSRCVRTMTRGASSETIRITDIDSGLAHRI